METLLETLFDYQKFVDEPGLQQVIDSVHAKYGTRKLDLDDLDMVAAAGTPELPDDWRQLKHS